MSWGEHGIVFGQPGKGILRVSPNGGVPEVIAAVNSDENADAPQMLPGGKALLFSRKKSTDIWGQGTGRCSTARRRNAHHGDQAGATRGIFQPGIWSTPLREFCWRSRSTSTRFPRPEGPCLSSRVCGAAVAPQAERPAAAQFGFSSNGSLVYIPGHVSSAGSGAQQLAIFDRKGPGESLKLPSASYSAPRVSPDGKWVAFEIADEKEPSVWVWELASTGAARRLTFGGRNLAPVWSADSQWVAFQSDREGDVAIFRQRGNGDGMAERLTKAAAGAVHIPQSWSPDGEIVLFTVLKDQLHTLSALAMKDRRISTFPIAPSSSLVEAAFSPDGRWVAYQSRESGENATYLQPFPTTGAKFLLPRAGGHPYWSRKGDEITLNIGPGRSAWIPVTTSPRLDFGRPEEFVRLARSEPNPGTTRRNVDALPDGRVLGVMSAAEAQLASANTPHIVVDPGSTSSASACPSARAAATRSDSRRSALSCPTEQLRHNHRSIHAAVHD